MNIKRNGMMVALIFLLVLLAVAIPIRTVFAASFTVNDRRDRVDTNPGNGEEQQLHSREKSENMPQLVITFAAAP